MKRHTRDTDRPRHIGIVWIISVAVFLSFPVTSTEARTATGASGLITVPSADVLPTGEAAFSVRYVQGGLNGSFAYGLLDAVEIGVNSLGTGDNFFNMGFLAKVNILEEDTGTPAVAIGTEPNRTYVAVSKRLAPKVRGHVGYGFGLEEGLFGGVSVSLSTTSIPGETWIPPTTLMAELVPGTTINAGVRLLFSPHISADLTLDEMKYLGASVAIRSRF